MSSKRSHILITGATGLIGIHLVRRLVNTGERVRILARKSSPLWPLKGLEIDIAYGDITDLNSLQEAVKGCDTVFHLAGYVNLSPRRRNYAFQVNVEGTRNILAACRNAQIKRLVHTSTMATIGEGQLHKPATESTEWNLKHLNIPYYDTKKIAEDLVIEEAAGGHIDAVIINPGIVFGSYDIKLSSARIIQIIASWHLPFYPRGGANFVGVQDIVDGAIAAWKHGRTGERYILGAENLSYKTLLGMIADRVGVHRPSIPALRAMTIPVGLIGDIICRIRPNTFSLINSATFKSYSTGHYVSSDKARHELAYRPHPVGPAIDETIAWLKSCNMLSRRPMIPAR